MLAPSVNPCRAAACQRVWRQALLLLTLWCLAGLPFAAQVLAANSVTVGSARVGTGGTTVVGIYVSNDVDIKQYIQPLKIVSVSGGSFITRLRVRDGGAGSRFYGRLNDIVFHNGYLYEDGACLTTAPNIGFGTISWNDTLSHAVYSSPVGLLIVRGKVLSAATVPPGADGVVPSFLLEFDVGYSQGAFVIDTTCTDPANHLVMARTTGTPSKLVPDFTSGVITIGNPDLAYWPECACPSPIESSDVITSPFGPRRRTSGAYDYHPGIDIDFVTDQSEHAITGGVADERKYISDDYGWFASIWSYGFDQEIHPVSYTARYLHMNQPYVVRGQIVARGDIIGTCGNWPLAPSHLHLETWPGFDPNKRNHPVRYLTKPELGCPEIDSTWHPVGSPTYDYLLCTVLSPKSDRYDLATINVWVYADSARGRLATVNFEDFQQMGTSDAKEDSVFTVFKDDPRYEVKITMRPHSLYTSETYHKIDIKIDPTRPFADMNWIGVYVEDVAKSGGPHQIQCGPRSAIGNVTGDTPGLIMQFFAGRRMDSTVELRWRGSRESGAIGVRILRSRNGAREQVIHSGLLPFRGNGGQQDTAVYMDTGAGLSDELVYKICAEFGDGSSLFADQIVMIPAVWREPSLPVSFDLGQNYPNPFNAGTRIPFVIDAASAGRVMIHVFDILGRHVATVFSSDDAPAGHYECEWDGRDSHGKMTATGVYFYRIETKGKRDSRKMLLLK